MIELTSVRKQFGDFVAVEDLSFSLQPGDVLGFLGPNGAGKSTTMKMITGFLSPDAGEIRLFGSPIGKDAHQLRQRIGYLPEGAPLYDEMTVAQFLKFIAEVRGGISKSRIKEVITQVQLETVLNRRIENLSKGFRRRVGLAQAILHDPDILILDEPTDGLDPVQKRQVRALLKNLAASKIVIISTHILEEVEALCNRLLIIAEGQMRYSGTPEDFTQGESLEDCFCRLVDQPTNSRPAGTDLNSVEEQV